MGICGKEIDKGHKTFLKRKESEINNIEKSNSNGQKAENIHQQRIQSSYTIQSNSIKLKSEKKIYDTKISDNKIVSEKINNKDEIKKKKLIQRLI